MGDKSDITEAPLKPLCNLWWSLLKTARQHKKESFQDDADEMMKFFLCGQALRDAMWSRSSESKVTLDDEESMPAPMFRIVVGKVAEGVELFGPTLYHRNPDIVTEPKTCEIPNEMLFPLLDPQVVQQAQMAWQQQAQMAQQQGQQPPPPFSMDSLIPPDPQENTNNLFAKLMTYYLNYIQRENDKKTQSRRAIDEAIIKGMGICWTESFETYPGGPTSIGSFYDTVDNLMIDPDAETIEECWWVARRRLQPYWEVAAKFKIDEDYLHEKYATHESASMEAITASDVGTTKPHQKKNGVTNDLIEYWEIYSKMGFGFSRLKGSPKHKDTVQDFTQVEETLEKFGDNVFFAIAEKVPFFLNFKTDHLHELMTQPDQEILDQMHEAKLDDVQWPVPFWADGQWPFTPFIFHEVPNNAWPMSHFKPGLGYLKFLNWVISFLINRIRVSARTVLATGSSVGDDLIQKLTSGKDFEVVQLESALGAGFDINKLVSVLQMPEVNADVWKIIQAVFDLFDKATGLTEIMYAAQGGSRSAEESRIKEGHASVRSGDMASKVDDALSLIARKEAMAARWLLDGQDLVPVLGQRCAALWEQIVASKDIQSVAREYNYRVEAGSTQKPDKDKQAQNAQQMIQVLPPLLQLAQNPSLYQCVKWMIESWADANNIKLPGNVLPAPVPQPNPEQQKIEAEIQGKQAELQMKQQGQQMDMQFKTAELQLKQQAAQADLQATQAKSQAEVQKAGMGMQIDQAKAQQDMALGQQKVQADVTLSKMDMLSNLAMKQQEAKVGMAEAAIGMQHKEAEHKQGLQHSEQAAQQARQQAKQKPTGEKK